MATRAGISIGIKDMVIPDVEAHVPRRGEHRRPRDRGPVQQGPHHRRRALQQGRRHLGRGDRPHRRRDAARARHRRDAGRAGRDPARAVLQPDLHDGRLRRPRLGAADPAARRHARPHGEAVGRDHRDAHHGELPRRADRAAVLHLDARRPQGPRRHGAQDGRTPATSRAVSSTSRRTRSSPSRTAARSTASR